MLGQGPYNDEETLDDAAMRVPLHVTSNYELSSPIEALFGFIFQSTSPTESLLLPLSQTSSVFTMSSQMDSQPTLCQVLFPQDQAEDQDPGFPEAQPRSMEEDYAAAVDTYAEAPVSPVRVVSRPRTETDADATAPTAVVDTGSAPAPRTPKRSLIETLEREDEGAEEEDDEEEEGSVTTHSDDTTVADAAVAEVMADLEAEAEAEEKDGDSQTDDLYDDDEDRHTSEVKLTMQGARANFDAALIRCLRKNYRESREPLPPGVCFANGWHYFMSRVSRECNAIDYLCVPGGAPNVSKFAKSLWRSMKGAEKEMWNEEAKYHEGTKHIRELAKQRRKAEAAERKANPKPKAKKPKSSKAETADQPRVKRAKTRASASAPAPVPMAPPAAPVVPVPMEMTVSTSMAHLQLRTPERQAAINRAASAKLSRKVTPAPAGSYSSAVAPAPPLSLTPHVEQSLCYLEHALSPMFSSVPDPQELLRTLEQPLGYLDVLRWPRDQQLALLVTLRALRPGLTKEQVAQGMARLFQ